MSIQVDKEQIILSRAAAYVSQVFDIKQDLVTLLYEDLNPIFAANGLFDAEHPTHVIIGALDRIQPVSVSGSPVKLYDEEKVKRYGIKVVYDDNGKMTVVKA